MKRHPLRPNLTPIPRRTRLRARGGKRFKARRVPKRFASHRDYDYQDYIRTLGCLICRRRPVDAAHVIPKSLGSDDRKNLWPACRQHHDEQEGRTAEFEAKHKINLAAEALRLDEHYPGPACGSCGLRRPLVDGVCDLCEAIA